MGDTDEILAQLRKAVEAWDKDLALHASHEALRLGVDPYQAIEKGLGEGMASISKGFNEGRLFLPQVLAASQAMEEGMKVFEPHLLKNAGPSKGTIVMGTVQGDIHEIGKHVVCAFLRAAGYEVYDLGKDVPPDQFVNAAREKKARLIGASALMTTTLVGQRRIVEQLHEERMYNVKTIFGGACCTAKWVESFGGDGYCSCGSDVVAFVEKLLH